MVTTASESINRLMARLERSALADAVARPLQRAVHAVEPMPLRDVLSGRPLGHPAHPMLMLLPAGAALGTAVIDTVPAARPVARRLLGLGIVGSLPAVAAGLTDWSSTTDAARRVGLLHGVLSTVGLGLMMRSWLVRGRQGSGRASALAAAVTLGASGWVGAHLAYGLGVGVDPGAAHADGRYAEAPASHDDQRRPGEG